MEPEEIPNKNGISTSSGGDTNVGGDIIGRDKIEVHITTPSSSDRDRKSAVEVLIAKYGLMGTLMASLFGVIGVGLTAYFGYLGSKTQIEAPIMATQTAEARLTNSASVSAVANNPTTTPAPSSMPVLPTDTPTPTLMPTEIVLPSPTPVTPTPIIDPDCLPAEVWTYYPRSTIPTDGCWLIPEFTPKVNGLQIGVITPPGSGEQQRGFYTLLEGNVDVQFTLRIENFETGLISTGNTFRPNIAFGIVEGSPFSYFNGIFLYYYASKPNIWRYDSQLAKEQNVFRNSALDIQQEQVIKFSIRGKRLTTYIDGRAANESTLVFERNAFYIGFRLQENTDLSITISELSIAPQE